MRKYTPRRCSKKWLDEDCPEGVLCIIAEKGKTTDVIYSKVHTTNGESYMFGREMDSNPFHPQGVGVSFTLSPQEVSAYRYRSKHRYARWSSLTPEQKKCVRSDLEDGQW